VKRQPTEIVALAIHALTELVAALVCLRAVRLEREFRDDFGFALPAPTQFVYDFHLPAMLCVMLVASFTAALFLRGLATLIVSLSSVGVGVISAGVIWWALRLPL
jgi:hypothetical protein